MNKLARYGLKALAWLVGVLVFIWVALWIYVSFNEDKLIGKISTAIQGKTRGEVKIGGLSVSFIRTFPIVSLQLSDISIKDSLYAIHKKELFTAANVYLKVSVPGLITGNSPLGQILVNNGAVVILTDTSGYSNEYVFKSDKKEEGEKKSSSFPDILFNNVQVTYINPLRNKFHQVMMNKMKCVINEKDGIMRIGMKLNMLIEGIAFNTQKGSYLKGKKLEGNFTLFFDKQKNDLLIQKVRLNIDDHPFHFNGKFHLEKVSPDFNLAINTYNIKFDKAISVLNDTIQSKLKVYAFNKPVDITVELNGKALYKYVPAARIIMDIDLQSANSFGSTAFSLEKGKAAINILFNGPIGRGDTILEKIDGRVDIINAEVKYLPRNFMLTGLNGSLKFTKDDLIVQKLSGNVGQTKLEMSGIAKKFVALLNKEPEKMAVRWKIYSPSLQLSDFKAFLSRSEAQKRKPRTVSASASSQIDKMFDEGDVYVVMETPAMEYKTFRATAVKADLVLKNAEITLQKVSFKHANGTMDLTGTMRNGDDSNPVSLHTTMRNMDIPLLFAAFDNFGQDAITSKNLKGRLSADIQYNTAVTNKAQLITQASEGTINFILENGELNNFAPIQEISKKVFKKQDFSQIRFASLQNKLDIKGTTFVVNPMEIRSTALNFFVEGIYDYKAGTDMSIRLPVRNLTKSQANTDLSEEGKAKKGVSLRLRARTGDDGKLKLSWDPFKRSVKNKQDVKDSADLKN